MPRSASAPKTSISSTGARKRKCPPSPSSTITPKSKVVRFHWLAQPLAIIEEDGRAAAVKFTPYPLGEIDASGRRNPKAIPGSEFEVSM